MKKEAQRKPLSKDKRTQLERLAYKKFKEKARREIKNFSDDTLEGLASGSISL